MVRNTFGQLLGIHGDTDDNQGDYNSQQAIKHFVVSRNGIVTISAQLSLNLEDYS